MVFCREIGWKEDEEAVDAREGVCNMTDMVAMPFRRGDETQASEPGAPGMPSNARQARYGDAKDIIALQTPLLGVDSSKRKTASLSFLSWVGSTRAWGIPIVMGIAK